MKKRKAEFQAELRLHNNLVIEEASSNIDNNKDNNLLWNGLRGNRRTSIPDTNSTPSLKEWENYFSKLSTSYDSNSVVLQLDERLKNFSADYMISEDMLRGAIKTLKAHCNLLLITGLVPLSFYIGINTIPKSGKKDLSSCSSWRPITRGSMIGKVFELCLKDLLEILDTGSNQVGFKRGLGYNHAHASFSKVIEEAKISGQPLYALLTDIKGAFDNIFHASALLTLIHAGSPLAVNRVLRFWYSGLKTRIRPSSSSSQSKLIHLGRGIRQGGIISPYIFNSCLATALNSLYCSFVSLSRNLSYIGYADDIILLSWSKSSLVSNFNILINCLKGLVLSISFEKCQFFVVNCLEDNFRLTLDCGNGVIFQSSPIVTFSGLPYAALKRDFKPVLVQHVQMKLRKAFGLLIRFRGLYGRDVLGRMYSAVALPHVLFPSLLFRNFRPSDLSPIIVSYFKFRRFLLGFPLSFSSTVIVLKLIVKDPVVCIQKIYKTFEDKAKINLISHYLFPFLVTVLALHDF